LATAEAGLEDAVMSIRDESNWSTGIPGKLFNGGSYTVTRSGNTVDSTGITGRGYTAKVSADITTSGTSAPYKVKINTLRINE